MAVGARAASLRAQGVDVLSFAQGEPDFDTPAAIKAAAWEALQKGDTKYAPVPGDPATRALIAEKLSRENGIPACTADHVVISSGGKQSLYHLFQVLLDPPAPGEAPWDVLLPVPAWVSYAPQAELAGGRVVELATTPEAGFKISPEQLSRAITPRSRVLVLNSPSNPCGTMYSPDELRALGRVVADAAGSVSPDLVVLSDEIYEKIVLGADPHFSIGSMPEIAERVVTVNGLSKSHAMTGWRVGYAAGSGVFGRAVAEGLKTIQSQTTTSIPSFILPAIRAALTQCAGDVEAMRRAFARRAELAFARLREIPGMNCPRPTGAFYLFPDMSSHFGKRSKGGRPIDSAMAFAAALLDEHHMAVVPGEDFGSGGERCVRISFACSEEQIAKGMTRLGEFVAGLR
ncbi:MAG: pyridoxal phosphate-dependent aminotransferase [Phycisphaerales bacterium]|nr:pyridoxal phosphate-dependent aminotransferase [Phycisphaerales bacterium]